MLTILVRKLDGDVLNVQAERKDKGEVVFDKVCESVDLVEKDYFGLQYEDKMGVTNWLDLNKRLGRTMKSDHWEFQFAVKFYPPDPSQLQEDVTRYQLCLQIRNDILTGKLLCSFVTYAMLGSYLVQSELGDYSPEEYPDASYLKNFRFAPDQTPQLEAKVMELHKTHKGQTPAEAELHYLENVKKLAMYGVDFHPAKDSEGVDITLGVCSTGLLVYHERLRINRFAWPKILKISYKRNYFYVKIRPGDYEPYENTIAFKLDSHRAAKRLWNVCVEHHTFFRLMTPEDVARPGLIPGLSNKFPSLRKTHYQTKRNTIEREPPSSFRKSQRYPTSKSLDPLVEQPSNREKDTANKRHTMPPENTQTSPVKREKRIPGAVPVLPVGEFRKKEREQKENGVANESDDEKENRNKEDNRYKEEKKSKKSTGLGLFKKNEGKRDKMEEIGVKREYEYDYEGDEPTSRKRSPKGFSYEKRNVEDYAEEEEYEEGMERRSPTKGRTYAFNYAPELDNKSPEPEEKHSSLSGFFKKKKKDDSSSPKRDSPLSTFLVGKSKDKDSSAKDKSKESDSPAKDKSKERDSPAKDKLKEKDASLKEKLKDKETSFSFKMKDKEASSKDKSKNKESTSKDKSTDEDSPAKDKLKDKDSLTDRFKGSLSLSAKDKSKDKDKESGKSKSKEFLEAEEAGHKSPDVSEKKKDSLSPKGLFRWGKRKDEDDDGGKPKVVKTTTKQSVVKDGGNVTHNIEEKIEDLTSGDVTLNTAESLMEDQGSSPYVMATAVTTRTAMTTEDLGKNAKTSQVEEKTVARTTTTSGTRQEQRVVTQEVRATTVVSEPQDTRRSSMSSTSSDDSGTPIDLDVSTSYCLPPYQEPIVETEAVFITSGKTEMPQATTTAPLVTTSTGLIGPPTIQADTIVSGEIISSQTITSKTRTVETVTYKTEKDGVVETRVEQKITIQSDGDPIDHDKALAEAIQEATAMNPDMQVEKIEIQQESLPK